MVFSSIEFLFLFLPIVLSLYLLVIWFGRWIGAPRFGVHASNVVMLLASLLFYYLGEKWLVVIMIVSSLTDYTAGLIMTGAWRKGTISQLPLGGPRTFGQRATLVGAIAINLGILFFFKYFNFSIDGWNQLVASAGFADWMLSDVARVTLPLGISFYTFQSMSYTIDVYRGEARATRNLLDFGCYVTMYPQLVAGPIVRYVDVATALTNRVIRLDQFVSGIVRLVIGLAKKVLIANTVAIPVDAIYALPPNELSATLAWIAVIGYALQIYFDFSGYSDMAIGLGRMLGFEFMENFAHPYAARSLRDFWRRWHISLSTWFRDYLYVPLGGNRLGARRTGLNLLIVFLICGLWHGAEWTFVVWGLWHGLFLTLERNQVLAGWLRHYPIVSHVYALAVVLVGWVIFRSASFGQAGAVLSSLFGVEHGAGVADGALRYFTPDVVTAFVMGIALSFPLAPALANKWQHVLLSAGRATPPLRAFGIGVASLGLCIMAFISVCALASNTYNPFIYFRF